MTRADPVPSDYPYEMQQRRLPLPCAIRVPASREARCAEVRDQGDPHSPASLFGENLTGACSDIITQPGIGRCAPT